MPSKRQRDIAADAKNHSHQILDRDVPEVIEGLEAARQEASGDLKLWLEAALEELRTRITYR